MLHGEIVHIISEFKPPAYFAESYSSLANMAQLQYYNLCVDQKNDLALRPFLVGMGRDNDTAPLFVAPAGVAPLPPDYDVWKSLSYIYDGIPYPVEVLDVNTFDYRKGHPTEIPDKRHPICNFQKNYINFAPVNLQYVQFKYRKHPAQVNMAVSVGAKGYAEYDSAHSVEFEWDDSAMLYIIQNILNLVGIPATLNEINNIKEKGGNKN